MFTIDLEKAIDLTLTLTESMSGVQFEPARTLETDGWNARHLHLYSHVGTHVDAPFHFGVSSRTIDDYPPAELMAPTWLIRLSDVKERQLITVNDLGTVRDKVKAGEGIIISTGWSNRIGKVNYRDGLPRISEELARWCAQKGIKMLGVEPPSVADVNDLTEVTRIHQILLSADIIIVEGLTNLEAIRTDRVIFMAFPLKIEKGDGAPARAIAFEIDD